MSFSLLKNTAATAVVAAALVLPGLAAAQVAQVDYDGPRDRPPGFCVNCNTSNNASTPWTGVAYTPKATAGVARLNNPNMAAALNHLRMAAAAGFNTNIGNIRIVNGYPVRTITIDGKRTDVRVYRYGNTSSARTDRNGYYSKTTGAFHEFNNATLYNTEYGVMTMESYNEQVAD